MRLRLAVWRPAGPARRTVLLFPGRTEHVEKYAAVAVRLTAAGLAVAAIDWRGQGGSDRLIDDPVPGHVADFSHYQLDVATLLAAVAQLGLPEPRVLLAHSMGGAIGLRALSDGLSVAAAVFSAPMWGIRVLRLPDPVGGRVAQGLTGAAARGGRQARSVPGASSVLDIPFSKNLLTGDVDAYARLMREAAAWPELALGPATWGWVGAATAECRALARLPAPAVPVTISVSGREAIVSPAAIRRRAARWPGAELVELPEARHEAMFEAPAMRERFWTAAMPRLAGGAG